MSSGRYNSATQTLNSGYSSELQLDTNGRLLTMGAVAGTVADPEFHRTIGGQTFATGQVANSVSPAAATLVVAARTGRQSVIIANTTGTQPVYLLSTAAITGVTTGHYLAGTAGASITLSTAAAIYSTSPTAAQTLSYLENY